MAVPVKIQPTAWSGVSRLLWSAQALIAAPRILKIDQTVAVAIAGIPSPELGTAVVAAPQHGSPQIAKLVEQETWMIVPIYIGTLEVLVVGRALKSGRAAAVDGQRFFRSLKKPSRFHMHLLRHEYISHALPTNWYRKFTSL